MTIIEIISISKDILLGSAAIITSGAAVMGLKRWKFEIKGRAEFEIARNLIRTTYKLREDIKNCRSSFTSSYEYPDGYRVPLGKHTAKEEAEAIAYIYKNRWEPIRLSLQEFDTHSLEAEVLWGKNIRIQTDTLRQCINELLVSIEDYISIKASDEHGIKNNDSLVKETYAVIFRGKNNENEFSKRIFDSISEIEGTVKPHLKKS
jgi:hypothetical protein